jgi:hypothetical protein
MKFKSLNLAATAFAGLADLSLGDALGASTISISFRRVSPEERGSHIRESRNLRDCSMAALHGPVKFPAPSPHDTEQFLSKLLCWHRNRNTRDAASDIVGVDPEDTARSIHLAASVSAAFCRALFAFDFQEAERQVDTIDWPAEFDDSEARAVIREMKLYARAFEVQRTAAWAWKIQHAPFDGMLFEQNYGGHSTIGMCLAEIELREKHLQFTFDLFKTGADKVSRKKFRFLDRYGLGDLRRAKPNEIYAAFGSGVGKLPLVVENCERQAEQYREIMKAIAGRPSARNDNPLIDYRDKRPDTFLAPVSSVVILAMRCAEFARALHGKDPAQPPEWLLQPNAKGAAQVEKAKFLQLFMFYRGVFVQDRPDVTVSVPDNECRSERRDELSVLPAGKNRPARDVISEMRRCVDQGLYGATPHGPAPVTRFGERFGWKLAA